MIPNARRRLKPRRSFARSSGITSRKVCRKCRRTTSARTSCQWASGLTTSVDLSAKTTGKTPTRDEFEGLTWSLYQFGKTITAAQYQLCWASLQRVSRQVAAWQQPYDALITPVLATPPMKLGTVNFEETDLMKGFAPITGYVPFAAGQNITGQPAISLPLAWSKAGLPIGVQFVGHVLLQLAAQIEWSNKRPPVYGFPASQGIALQQAWKRENLP